MRASLSRIGTNKALPLLLALIGLGITLGIVQAARMHPNTLQLLESRLTADFLEHKRQSGIFVQSALQNGIVMLLLWLTALLPAGNLIAAAVLLVKAMGYGYTCSVLTRIYGGAGILFTLTRLGPQGLIWLAAAVFLCMVNYKSGGVLRREHAGGKLMTEYFLALLLAQACVILAAFI